MSPGPVSISTVLKRLALRLPLATRQSLKRLHYRRQLSRGTFAIDDAEVRALRDEVREGTWVLDVGASVGRYAAAFSGMVGPGGRVLAFEPVQRSFELLAANVQRFPLENVTLFSCAVSSSTGLAGMAVPSVGDGTEDLYFARLEAEAPQFTVMTLAVDDLDLPTRVSLVKIDVEGHELGAVRGMAGLLRRDRPLVLVEGEDPEVAAVLHDLGYGVRRTEGSPNRLFRHRREGLPGRDRAPAPLVTVLTSRSPRLPCRPRRPCAHFHPASRTASPGGDRQE